MEILTLQNLRQRVIGIEKVIMRQVQAEFDQATHTGGDFLGRELVASVAALFAARCVAWMHLYSREPLDQIKNRFMEAFEKDLTISLNLLKKNMAMKAKLNQ
jgi:hypothetical protein